MRRLLKLTALFLFLAGSASLIPHRAQALSGSDLQAGRIIDNVVFTVVPMSAQDIQNFLNAKVPSCDTGGTKLSSHPNGSGGYYTRAQWGAVYDSQNDTTIAAAPYVCLKDYVENPTTHQNNLQNPGASIPGGMTAAQIIYDRAVAYHINPEVILTTLQKEQGLVTDDWPWVNEYQAAMGYACPDDGSGCHSQYSGFYKQVDSAAWQFRDYLDNPGKYTFAANQNNYISYYPCSYGGTVFIQNSATAGLYDYTPYQPDANVLSTTNPTGSTNGPGSDINSWDGCATYGNRNFWWYFNTWFGNSQLFNGNVTLSAGLTLKDASTNTPIADNGQVYAGQTVTGSYTVSNSASVDTLAGGLGVCARLNGDNIDFGYADQTNIPANGSVTVTYNKKLLSSGTLSVFVCSYHASLGGWASSFYPYSSGEPRTLSAKVLDNPLMVSSVTFSSPDGPLSAGQTITANVTIHNYAPSAVSIGPLTVAARDVNNYNADFTGDPNATIPGGADKQFSFTRFIYTPGPYKYWLTNLHNGSWDTSFPLSSSGALTRSGTFIVQNSPTIISPVSFTPSTTPINQQITASFTIHNFGDNPVDVGTIVIASRDKNGYNADFSYITPGQIAAHSSYTYNGTRTMVTPGRYTYWIANFKDNSWNSTYPLSASWVNVNRSGSFTVQ